MSQEQRRQLGMAESGFADEPVVRDAKIITARAAGGDDFAHACVGAVAG